MISVVIVSYNTVDLLRACLESLQRQTARLQTIVVDNASADGSDELVRKQFPDVALIANQTNRGFAAANNQGFDLATGEFVLMLNSDTELPERDVLEKLAGYLRAHPHVGIVAPRLAAVDGEIQHSAGWTEPTLLTLFYEYTLLNRVLYRLFPEKRYPGKQLLSRSELERTQVVGDLLGACLLVRRRLIEQAGGLDERFFIFLEETDFNLRIRQRGFELHYLPDVAVVHHWGGSIDSVTTPRQRYDLYYPSLYAFLTKHRGRSYAAAAYGLAVVCSLAAAVGLAVLWLPLALAGTVTRRPLARAVANQWRVVKAVLRWHLRRHPRSS